MALVHADPSIQGGAFAAPRRWNTPPPDQRTDAWATTSPYEDYYSVHDEAAVSDMERQLTQLYVAEMAEQRLAANWRPRAPQPWELMTSAPEPWQQMQPIAAPPPLRKREKEKAGWNLSTHAKSCSFSSRVADADTADRQRKEAFKLRKEPPMRAREEQQYRQREYDNKLARPAPDRGERQTHKPRRQRRHSDPNVKVPAPRTHDQQAASLARRQRDKAEAKGDAQARRFRQWEQRAGEGRGLAGREMVGEWRTIRSKEERLRAVADATGAEIALEHGLPGAFGGYDHHCLNDAGATHALREKLAREKSRALELSAQIWEERAREHELEKALEHQLHVQVGRQESNGWGLPSGECRSGMQTGYAVPSYGYSAAAAGTYGGAWG